MALSVIVFSSALVSELPARLNSPFRSSDNCLNIKLFCVLAINLKSFHCKLKYFRFGSLILWTHSLKSRGLYDLFLLDALILFHHFGGDGRSRFGGVALLNVSGGSGDGSPSLATTDAGSKGGEDEHAKQQYS